MKKLTLPRISVRAVLFHAALVLGMVLFNFVLPAKEPLSFALLYAGIFSGAEPFTLAAGYLVASAVSLSPFATLSALLQAAFLLFIALLYRRSGRTAGFERLLYAALAQIPFLFLFPHPGYALFPFAPIYVKLILAALIFLFSALTEGAMNALLHRVFRARLAATEVCELALLWLIAGMGILSSVGEEIFSLVAFTALLGAVILFRNASCVPFSAALALPLVIDSASLVPLAEFAIYASFALLVLPYGRSAAALTLPLAFTGLMYFDGLFDRPVLDIVLALCSAVLPALFAALAPKAWLRRAEKSLLFYRDKALPRIAVNRSRRAVAEQLYEVSSLFREIETSFTEHDLPDRTAELIRQKLTASLCNSCPNRGLCTREHLFESFDKLIAVGKAKGRVNLIDLPVELSAKCSNAAGLLFALNHQLAEYARMDLDLETAREGRRLLAKQAHGVSEILKEIALTESEEYVFSDEEHRLFSALAREGLLASEIFLYGEGEHFTASMTLDSRTDGKRISRIASETLGMSLALSEKIPLTPERASYILKKRPLLDASFGIAARTKEGEQMSGDTHSILKIDERRFLVALSDGMGSGEEARAVSDRTLSLLESFYKARMPSETVLSTVNSLVAYSSEETFACLDLAAVNLDTGKTDVVKIGSPAGFVLSGDTLQVLEGESLPIGVLEAVHPACLRVDMKENDFLIFMSDGVSSAFGSSSELCSYLSRIHPINPQSLAEEILKTALARYGGSAEDDMTVLTVKLTKTDTCA